VIPRSGAAATGSGRGGTQTLRPGTSVGRFSAQDRITQGKKARLDVPLERHADWRARADRSDPIGLLESQARSRIPELVPIRYGRMMVSPFSYFRGAALPMAEDL